MKGEKIKISVPAPARTPHRLLTGRRPANYTTVTNVESFGRPKTLYEPDAVSKKSPRGQTLGGAGGTGVARTATSGRGAVDTAVSSPYHSNTRWEWPSRGLREPEEFKLEEEFKLS